MKGVEEVGVEGWGEYVGGDGLTEEGIGGVGEDVVLVLVKMPKVLVGSQSKKGESSLGELG